MASGADQESMDSGMHSASPRLTGVEPILAVRDISEAVAYYRDVLDFPDTWTWGDPPTHGGARRDGIQVQFSLNSKLAETAEGRQVGFFAQQIRVLYEAHRARGAEIVSELEEKPWGVTEYTVRDPNGYQLRFGGSGSAGSAEKTEKKDSRVVEIESRLPNRQELSALAQAVGWGETTDLSAAILGTVAVEDGRVIGCAMFTTDGAGYYQLRDVMVQPDRQRSGVGTALVKRLMDELRSQLTGGALVGLYTGAQLHDFYARFGFKGPESGLYGMTIEMKGRNDEGKGSE